MFKATHADATAYKHAHPLSHTWQWANPTHFLDTMDENTQIHKCS